MQSYTHTALGHIGMFTIGKTPYILDAENLEYVVETGTKFHIGPAGIHDIDGILARETPQVGVTIGQQGVVLVRQICRRSL